MTFDCPSRRCMRLPARWLRLSLASILLSFWGGALALGLGDIAQQSALGAPLRVVVPVTLAPGENLVGECVRLLGTGRGDGVPEVLTARVTLERSAAGTRVVVSSPRTVSDPLLKFTLEVGCNGAVRREYTMLMDPVPIEIPTATAVAAPAVAAPAATPATGAVPIPRAGSAQAGASTSSTRSRVARPRAGVAVAVAPGPPAPAQGTPARATKGSRTGTPPAMVATAPLPKLSVSTNAPETAQTTAAGIGGGGAPGADTRRDLSPRALDAEAAALQLRVLELTAMVDRMQADLRAAEAAQTAQAARFAAEKAALTSPQATLARWWSDGWPFVVVLALAALIATLLALRRRRTRAQLAAWPSGAAVAPARSVPARRPAPAVTQPGTAPVTHGEPVAAVAAPAPPAPAPQAVVKQPAAAPLDVSEISHVTEEAGVYLAFNRPDRAMEVLEEHIRTSPHSLPAAWLMLLDLYHKQGREPEFNELAQRFHAQFNAQQPSWDAYRQHAQSERGLEGFPHIVRHLVAGWNKPECRDYLDHLLRENRDGRRTGFSLAAYEDIVFLRQLAEVLASGPDVRMRPITVAPAPRPVPVVAAVATASPKPKRAPTLDLELALDEDMLDSRRALKVDKPKIA